MIGKGGKLEGVKTSWRVKRYRGKSGKINRKIE